MDKENAPFVLAIDHGTSGLKVALVSVFGKVIGWEFEKTPLYLGKGGAAEQSTEEWWAAFLKAGKRLIGRNLIPHESIKAVCVSSQWSTTIPIDKDGTALTNAISWMDSRGAPYVQKVMGGPIKISGYGLGKLIRWIRITGGGPGLAGKGPVGHILYLKNERPEVYAKTYKFLEAKDFLNLKLTGKALATFDSNHLIWALDIRDVNNIHYDERLLEIMEIDKDKMPELIKSTDVVGTLLPEVAEQLGLPENIEGDIKVFGGSPDLHAAAIGSGGVRDFEPHIYLGTSSWVIAHVPFKKTDVFHNMASVPSANPSRFMVATEQENAGNCLTFLRDNFVFYYDEENKPHEYSELDEIAKKVPAGSNNLIFTPWIYGERTPIEDHLVRGGFFNLSLSHTFDDAVRAVFEGVALNSRWVFQYVEKFCGRKLDPVILIGGGASSDIWCQIYADVLNRRIKRLKNPIQANAMGAAFIAGVGMGEITFDQIPDLVEYDKEFEPNPNHKAIYDKLFEVFVQLYKKNRNLYKKLNAAPELDRS